MIAASPPNAVSRTSGYSRASPERLSSPGNGTGSIGAPSAVRDVELTQLRLPYSRGFVREGLWASRDPAGGDPADRNVRGIDACAYTPQP